MKKETLWSLRLGFSGMQASKIKEMGLAAFLEKSFSANAALPFPDFLADSPHDLKALNALRKEFAKDGDLSAKKELIRKEIKVSLDMKAWWIGRMQNDDFPLLEKTVCFWHNHFVSTYQKVKVNYWIYQHYMTLRENAFGNFKTLVKKAVASNAMLRYLDNTDNRRDKQNENLSRELLELFTLGIGNYTEADIKNGAKGLAGLLPGDDHGLYYPRLENPDTITYLGKTGTLKLDEMVDAIFEHPKAGHLVVRKMLQWFLYDDPDEELVKYYGDYFRKAGFEIKPLLLKMFTEEYKKDNAGQKIKDPLLFDLQLAAELNIENERGYMLAIMLKRQGMDLFNQPNVKGWNGGKEWLTAQTYLQRGNIADKMCLGLSPQGKTAEMTDDFSPKLKISIDYDRNGSNLDIIKDLSERLLFQVTPDMQADFERILKYDFDPNSEGADQAVIRLFNDMAKRPEFQLI